MAKLEDLTVPLLNKLAKEYHIEFKKNDKKADKIAKIYNLNLEKEHLNSLVNKYLAQKKKLKVSTKDDISELKGRIRLLEEQVRFLMSKISASEVKISKKNNHEIITITSDLSDIKRFIKSLFSPGESVTIDQLIEMEEIQKIPLVSLKHAIYDLIDENSFEPFEKQSHQKIGGKISALLRLED